MSSPMDASGSLQVRHDKLRNRMATLRGCVRRVAAHWQDREGKPGQGTIFCPMEENQDFFLSWVSY
jgi:hypothetical protein